jgi:hypothetical protein
MPTTQGPVPNHSQIMTGLRAYLLDVLGSDWEVVEGQANRVPEPISPNFVVMTMGRRDRLSANVDRTADARFTGYIAGSTMTIMSSSGFPGSVAVGDQVYGIGVASPTVVTGLGTGTGGVGTYVVAPAQTVGSAGNPIVLSTGTKTVLQATKLEIQLDVHGPGSHDGAQVISTLTRDEYATRFFSDAVPFVDMAPLYADDPIQVPFVNDQDQFEDRYVIRALFQANQTVTVPQQYADSVVVGLIEADLYPP